MQRTTSFLGANFNTENIWSLVYLFLNLSVFKWFPLWICFDFCNSKMIDIFQVLIDTFDLPDVCFKIQSSPFFRKSIYTGTIKGSILKASLTLMAGQRKKSGSSCFQKH